MKDTPDSKVIVRICAINWGPVSRNLTASLCATFEDLFVHILTWELTHSSSPRKAPQFASVDVVVVVNATSNYNGWGHDRQGKSKFDKGKNTSSNKHPRKQLRDMKEYTFELKNIERWFDFLLNKGKMTPLNPGEPVQLDDKKHEDYCQFHHWVDHPIYIS